MNCGNAGLAVRTIRKLGESRRLEPFSGVHVNVESRRNLVRDAANRGCARIRDGTAVIRIACCDEVVLRVEAHFAVPHAREHDQVVTAPFGLRVHIVGAHGVVFVALQRTGHAEVVDEAAAPFAHAVVVVARGEIEERGPELHRMGPSKRGASV